MRLHEILSPPQLPPFLYHGTSLANARKILSIGFKPRGIKNTFGKSISFSDQAVGTRHYEKGVVLVCRFLPSAKVLSLNEFHKHGRGDADAVIGGPGGYYGDREIAVFNPESIEFVGWYNYMTKKIDKEVPVYPAGFYHDWNSGLPVEY